MKRIVTGTVFFVAASTLSQAPSVVRDTCLRERTLEVSCAGIRHSGPRAETSTDRIIAEWARAGVSSTASGVGESSTIGRFHTIR